MKRYQAPLALIAIAVFLFVGALLAYVQTKPHEDAGTRAAFVGYPSGQKNQNVTAAIWSSSIYSDPAPGSEFRGQLTVINNGAPVGQRPIHSEKWEYRIGPGHPWKKSEGPPDVTTYYFVVRAAGKGVLYMLLNDRVERYFDVGSFRNGGQLSAGSKKCLVSQKVRHQAIHSYPESYEPSLYDTKVPIENRGLESQVKAGVEPLNSYGIRNFFEAQIIDLTSKRVREMYGIKKWPSMEGRNFGYAAFADKKWHWKLEHFASARVIRMKDQSFSVTLLDPIVISAGTAIDSSSPVVCPNCKRYLEKYTDHTVNKKDASGKLQPLTCAMDGEAEGCGEHVYICTPIKRKVQEDWHRERVCEKKTFGVRCDVKYRNCVNRSGDGHWHSDGNPVMIPEHWPLKLKKNGGKAETENGSP